VLVVFILSLFLMSTFDRILMPRVDQGQFLMRATLPVGTRVEVTNDIAEIIEAQIAQIPELDNITVMVGSTRGTSSEEFVGFINKHSKDNMEIFKNVIEREGESRRPDDSSGIGMPTSSKKL